MIRWTKIRSISASISALVLIVLFVSIVIAFMGFTVPVLSDIGRFLLGLVGR